MIMPSPLHRLNDAGIARFAEFLSGGATQPIPEQLLLDPACSEPLRVRISPERRIFADRFVFGQYLVNLLAPLDAKLVSGDTGLWSALALFWFDQLCPPDANGKRRLAKDYSYILSSDYRHYYRHLVRSPWQLVRDHVANAKFLLLAPTDGHHELRRHGEVLEQLGSVQSILRSRHVIAEVAQLYADPATGRPRRGVAGSGPGSARRLRDVLRQFDLTFDPDLLPAGRLIELLPNEFARFKST
jgi:hypothetical protein